MENFTQGEWILGADKAKGCVLSKNGRLGSTLEGPISHPIARFDMGWDEKEDQANGRLLVKAPSMYHLLRKIQGDFHDAQNFRSDADLLDILKNSINEIEPLMQEILDD